MLQIHRKGASLLDEVLERRMLLYVLAAGTALSGASAAQAKVVFTPSNAVLVGPYSVLQIDLDNDGVTDFVLAEDSVSISTSTVKTRKHPDGFSFFHVIGVYSPVTSDGVEVQSGLPEALIRGSQIRGKGVFANSGLLASAGSRRAFGNFLNIIHRFLGVRFLINGEAHYGWIGFRRCNGFAASLVGWAYETEPDKPILAGDRGEGAGSASVYSPESTSLQLLALGHTGIANRQRRIAAQAIS